MRYALLIITDGRADYLQRTLESFAPTVDPEVTIVVDDHSPLPATVPDAVHIYHAEKRGGAGSIRTGWRQAREQDVDFIFHLEDDWTFPQPVDIEAMAWVLEQNPTMANVALRRDSSQWDPGGDYINGNPTAFVEHTTMQYSRAWLSHTQGFWLNPCMYRREIIEKYEWPEHGTEGDFSAVIAADGWHYGILGRKQDPPRAIHIGTQRSQQWTW